MNDCQGDPGGRPGNHTSGSTAMLHIGKVITGTQSMAVMLWAWQ